MAAETGMAACRVRLGVGATLSNSSSSSSSSDGGGWSRGRTMPCSVASGLSCSVPSRLVLVRRGGSPWNDSKLFTGFATQFSLPSGSLKAAGASRPLQGLNETDIKPETTDKPSFKCSRRRGVSTALLSATSVLLGQVLNPNPALAEETVKKEEGGTFVDGVLELLDPDQVTKTGKKLPKKYVKSVREVVKSLRESFTQDSGDGAKFRRNADSAKEAIRDYLQNWRGSKIVETEDSYVALERAFRELGKFYSSKGPQAALPEDIRNRVLEDLNKADDSL